MAIDTPPPAICLAAPPIADPGAADVPPVRLPAVPRRAAAAQGFVPRGWVLEKAIPADLDRDGQPDLVAVVKGADRRCLVPTSGAGGPMDSNPRLLLVAFRRQGGFALHLANARVIPRLDDPYMDDPFEIGGLSVRAGVIRLQLGNWRSMGGWGTSSSTLSFRWNGTSFPLIGFDREHLQRNSGETEDWSVNLLTARARIAKGSMEDDVPTQTRWRKLPAQPVPMLETIGDGLAYQPRL